MIAGHVAGKKGYRIRERVLVEDGKFDTMPAVRLWNMEGSKVLTVCGDIEICNATHRDDERI